MPRPAASLLLPAKLRWVALLYLVEGLPYGLLFFTLQVYFKDSGVSNQTVGLLSLLGAPYALKILWSPLVDRWPDTRRWTCGALVILALLLATVPLFEAGTIPPALWVVLLLMAIVSATQDVAIDAYTIRLTERGEEGQVNSVRVASYRVALLLMKSVLLLYVIRFGYPALFWATSAGLLILAAVTMRLPRLDAGWERSRGLEAIVAGVRRWLAEPGSLGVLLFLLLYNLSDITIAPMIPPFWLDSGYEVGEFAAISGGLGVGLTIAGALVGGWIVSRIGIFRGLWMLGLTQGMSNLGYAAVAWWGLGRPAIYSASIVESFTDGLGSASLLAFLMRLCEKELAATEFALLSAVFGLARPVFGAPSGFVAERMGYDGWFLVTFLLGFVMFAFLPAVRRRLQAVKTSPG